MNCCGDPVWAGTAVGREDDAPWPLVVAGAMPPRRSAIGAFSSSRTGVKGWGCLSASSRVQRMALLVRLDSRTAGCGSGLAGEEYCRLSSKGAVGVSSGSSLRSWEACRRKGLNACSDRPGSARSRAVEKNGRRPMPTVAASRWTRRCGSDARGLGLGEKRGVRRRVRWEDGVGDLSSCGGVTTSCRRGIVRRWRCTGGVVESQNSLGIRGNDAS